MGFAVLQSATHLARSQDLLSWASPGSPLHRIPSARPLPIAGKPAIIGPPLPYDESCSVPVVSHHLDGLLRALGRGFVAPRYRSWGPPRFRLASAPVQQAVPSPTRAFPATHPPFEEFPHQQPYRVTTAITFMSLPRDNARRPTRPTTLCTAEAVLHVVACTGPPARPKPSATTNEEFSIPARGLQSRPSLETPKRSFHPLR